MPRKQKIKVEYQDTGIMGRGFWSWPTFGGNEGALSFTSLIPKDLMTKNYFIVKKPKKGKKKGKGKCGCQ